MIISLKIFLPSCLGTGQIELKMQALLVRDLIHNLSEVCHEVYGTCLSKGKDSVVLLSLGKFPRLPALEISRAD